MQNNLILLWLCLSGFIIGLMVIYAVVRLGSFAWFRSRLWYDKKLREPWISFIKGGEEEHRGSDNSIILEDFVEPYHHDKRERGDKEHGKG